MAEKITLKAAKKSGSSTLDKAMAAFAAASVGFVTYVMPADIFSGLVTGSGLPAVVPAAQPPLGDTARLAVVIAAAFATFLAVWLLLRALNKVPAGRKSGRKVAEVPNDPPRLRRADMHPDAPSRSPILAGRELGVPLDEMAVDERGAEQVDLAEVENVDYEAEWERPLPGFIEEAQPAVAAAPEAEPAEVEAEREPEETASDLPSWVAEDAEVAAAEESADSEAVPVEAGTVQPEEEAAEPAEMPFWAADEAEDVSAEETEERSEEAEPSLDEPAETPFAVQDQPELDELGQRLPKKQALEHESIDHLVDRVETGIGRRDRARWTSDQAAAPESEEDRNLQNRLRGAIGDLRRMARR